MGERVSLENGKYTFYRDEKGTLRCDRYGERWRNFAGDKAVNALFDLAVLDCATCAADSMRPKEGDRG